MNDKLNTPMFIETPFQKKTIETEIQSLFLRYPLNHSYSLLFGSDERIMFKYKIDLQINARGKKKGNS